MTVRVLITDGMAPAGVDILKENGNFDVDLRKSTPADELKQIIGDYQSIVIRSATTLTQELIEQAANMKLIVRAGAGVDNIDVPVATEKKIPVMNTASANSLAAAEQTIALMFSLFRLLPQSYASMKEGKWDRASFKGYEVTGKVMGVIGLGNIGRIVAEKAVGLGMQVVAYDPFIKDLNAVPSLARHAEVCRIVDSIDQVFETADVVSPHVPKTKDTQHLINADRINKMKKGSWVLNCARGGIADEDAVLAALDSGQLTGAAFDVYEKEPPNFEHPIFKHPKVVFVPHLGASTVEAQQRVALTAAQQMVDFFTKNSKAGVINGV